MEINYEAIDYENFNNISIIKDLESNSIVGYTKYGGLPSENNERTYYFENAKEMLPEGFFDSPFDTRKFVLLEDPYEIRRNPNYEQLLQEEKDKEIAREQQESTKVSREEHNKLKKELEEIKALLQNRGE